MDRFGFIPESRRILASLGRNLVRAWPVYLTLVAVVAGGTFWLKRQGEVANPILPTASAKMEPHIELMFKKVTMQGREKGTVRWRISSEQVSASQNQQFVYFEKQPRGTFYNLKDWDDKPPAGNRAVDWTADRAEYDSFAEAMVITGNAVFTTDSEDVIKTHEVQYKAKQHGVTIPKPLELRAKDGTILRAQRATADTEMEQLDLHGGVELISQLKESL